MIKLGKSFLELTPKKYIRCTEEKETYFIKADDFSFQIHKSFPKDRLVYYVSKLLKADSSDSTNPFTFKDTKSLGLKSLEVKLTDGYFSGFLLVTYKDYFSLVLEPPKVAKINSLIDILKELDKEVPDFFSSRSSD
jgi:hypothetical protein